MVYLFKPATTPRAFSLRSNRCAARPEGLGGSCVPGQGLVRIECSQYKTNKPYRMQLYRNLHTGNNVKGVLTTLGLPFTKK